MTKKQTQARWELTKDHAKVTMPDQRSKLFDLKKLFIHVNFEKIDSVELETMFYGVKQKLADSLTQLGKDATTQDKFDRFDQTWTRLCNERLFNTGTKAGGKLITKSEYMAEAASQGIPEEMAEKLWDLARTKQQQ